MPVFYRPARVEVSDDGGGILVAVGVVLIVVVVLGAVVAFIFAHLLLLAGMVVVVVVGTYGAMRLAGYLGGPLVTIRRRPVPRATLRASAAVRALPPPRRAIPPAQHIHIHLDGLTAEETSRVLAEWRIPPAAIEAGEPPSTTP